MKGFEEFCINDCYDLFDDGVFDSNDLLEEEKVFGVFVAFLLDLKLSGSCLDVEGAWCCWALIRLGVRYILVDCRCAGHSKMAMVAAAKSCVDCAYIGTDFSLESDEIGCGGNAVNTGQFRVFKMCCFVVHISFGGHVVDEVCGSRCAVILLLLLFIKLCQNMRVR